MSNTGFTNGGQIPAYGNEKTSDQIIQELREENERLKTALEKIEFYCARHEYNPVACMVRDAANIALQQEGGEK